jgi:MFS family permease
VRKVLAHRDARRYLIGQLLSLIGDTSLWLGVGIYVKDLTGSSAQAGLTFFFFGLPYLFAPPLGLIVDRLRRRPLMIATNLSLAVVVCGLFFVHDANQVWLIYLVMTLYGLGGALLAPAQSALLTVVLPSDLLGDANGLLQTGREVLRLVTPLLGASVVAATHGVKPLVIGDAVTFLVASAAIASMQIKEVKPQPNGQRLRLELLAGVRHVRDTLPLRQIVIAIGIALLFVGMNESLIFAVVQHGLKKSPSYVGILIVAQGVGSLIGAPAAGPVLRRLGDGLTAGLGLALIAVAELGQATGRPVLIYAGAVCGGFGIPGAIVAFSTSIQTRTPAELQGRAYAAADAIVSTPQTLSVAIGAALVSVVSYRLLLGISAAVIAACAVYLCTRPEHRRSRVAVDLDPGLAEPVPAADVMR